MADRVRRVARNFVGADERVEFVEFGPMVASALAADRLRTAG